MRITIDLKIFLFAIIFIITKLKIQSTKLSK